MKHFFLLLTFFCVMSQMARAQLSFKIDELILSYYNINLDKNTINEDLENGPYVFFNCLIINNSDTSVILKPIKSKIRINYRYNKCNYDLEVYPLPFIDNEELIISTKDTINLFFGSYLLLGTNIFDYKQTNYTREMLAILPTLKVVYRDEKIKIYTDEIRNVTLNQ